MRPIAEHEIKKFQESGLLHMQDFFSETEKLSIIDWVNELAARPDTPGKWMKYYEPRKGSSDNQKILCRVENFFPYHEQFALSFGNLEMLKQLGRLMGEPAVLFKEKINFKYPGGGGFTPHQDAPAFTTFNQTFHITFLFAVNQATPANGCLEFAYDYEKETMLKQATDGTIHQDVVDQLDWRPFPVNAGDVVLFDSYIPHRSHANNSDTDRTSVYITYNKESEGCFREEYYNHKREVFPQDCEREPGKDYSAAAGVYNLGNPIK